MCPIDLLFTFCTWTTYNGISKIIIGFDCSKNVNDDVTMEFCPETYVIFQRGKLVVFLMN